MSQEHDRGRFALYAALLVFALLALRLFELQILDGSLYRKASEQNRLRVVKLPPPRGVLRDRTGQPLVRNIPVFCLSMRPEAKSPESISLTAALSGLSTGFIQKKLDGASNPFDPVRLKEGLSFAEAAYFESRTPEHPGLLVEVDFRRNYPFGQSAAHLLGYIGRPTKKQQQTPLYSGLPPDVAAGRSGAEKLFDSVLSGTPGKRVIEVDALGRQLAILSEEPPSPGTDVTLSIDIALQTSAERAFREHSGALVALAPDTGEVLALVSRPSFDPNVFVEGISAANWAKLSQDAASPLFNRALQGQYSPGSTFKIITALAALESAYIGPDTMFYCDGGYKSGNRRFRCWNHSGHGQVSLWRSIVESCDVYYYMAAELIGMDPIRDMAHRFGLDSTSGLGLTPERAGIIPNAAWKELITGGRWYQGDTFNSAIGQGFVSLSPIELALLAAETANGGYLIKPTLVKASDNPQSAADKGPVKIPLNEADLNIIKSALKGVVNSAGGTGRPGRSAIVEIAGKTGTTQVVSRGKKDGSGRYEDHAFFVGYAPADNPQIAVAVVVEHGGGGGSAAAPVAREAIEAYFGRGYTSYGQKDKKEPVGTGQPLLREGRTPPPEDVPKPEAQKPASPPAVTDLSFPSLGRGNFPYRGSSNE